MNTFDFRFKFMLQFPRIEILRAELQLIQPQQLSKQSIQKIQSEATRLYQLISQLAQTQPLLSTVCEFQELKQAFNNSCNEKHLFRNFCQLNYNSDFHSYIIQFILNNQRLQSEIIQIKAAEQFQTHFLIKSSTGVNRTLSFPIILVFSDILDVKTYDENALLSTNFQKEVHLTQKIEQTPEICSECCTNCELLSAEILNLKLIQNELKNKMQGEINRLNNELSIQSMKGSQSDAEKGVTQESIRRSQELQNEKQAKRVLSEEKTQIEKILKDEIKGMKVQKQELEEVMLEEQKFFTQERNNFLVEISNQKQENQVLLDKFDLFKEKTSEKLLQLEQFLAKQNKIIEVLKEKPKVGQISEVAQYIINDLEEQIVQLKQGKTERIRELEDENVHYRLKYNQ